MTIHLGEEQQFAVDQISKLDRKIYVITGGAGAGKTTVLQHLLRKLWSNQSSGVNPDNTFIGCPTGKSAKVVNNAMPAGFLVNEAKTIHRLLEFNPGVGWMRNEDNPLDAKMIICDESSMIGSELLSQLIKATPDGCHMILVGDANQLNPVDAGAPFHDIINFGDPSVIFRLDKNYRQQKGSLIAHGCLAVLAGNTPTFGEQGKNTLGGELLDDLFFIEEEEKEEIPRIVGDLCEEWHKAGLDYAVLSPQKTGVCGVEAMNKYLQERLNPAAEGKEEVKAGWVMLREGDKVLQTKNNYQLGVFNGFTGRVVSISKNGGAFGGEDLIIVDFDGETIEYEESDHIKQLALGYCMTVHKSQGSQFQHGVLVCHSSHYYMWSRSILYTGISRFREELWVVGNKKALKRGVQNVVSGERNTLIKLRLRGEE